MAPEPRYTIAKITRSEITAAIAATCAVDIVSACAISDGLSDDHLRSIGNEVGAMLLSSGVVAEACARLALGEAPLIEVVDRDRDEPVVTAPVVRHVATGLPAFDPDEQIIFTPVGAADQGTEFTLTPGTSVDGFAIDWQEDVRSEFEQTIDTLAETRSLDRENTLRARLRRRGGTPGENAPISDDVPRWLELIRAGAS